MYMYDLNLKMKKEVKIFYRLNLRSKTEKTEIRI